MNPKGLIAKHLIGELIRPSVRGAQKRADYFLDKGFALRISTFEASNQSMSKSLKIRWPLHYPPPPLYMEKKKKNYYVSKSPIGVGNF